MRDYEFRYGWLCIGFKKSVWVPLRECSREQYAKRVGSRVMIYTILENQKRLDTQFAGLDDLDRCGNDPSAGSPTETLLRLHLPLDVEI